jgi:hypothetical protein
MGAGGAVHRGSVISKRCEEQRAKCALFSQIGRESPKPEDLLAEGSEFELPVPVSKLSDDSVVL